MGLKGSLEFKQLLFSLFPEAFVEDFAKVQQSVDVVIVDLNLDTHKIQGAKHINSTERFERELRQYPLTRFQCFPKCKLFIGTMDDSMHVPKAKRIEQVVRDETKARSGALLSFEEQKELGVHAHITKHNAHSAEVIYSFMEKYLTTKEDKEFLAFASRAPGSVRYEGGPSVEEEKRALAFRKFLTLLMSTRATRKEMLRFASHKYLDVPRGALPGGRTIIYDGIPFPRPKGKVSLKNNADRLLCAEDEAWIYEEEDPARFEEALNSSQQLWLDPRCLKDDDYFDRPSIPAKVIKEENAISIKMEHGTATMGEGDIKIAHHAVTHALEGKCVWVACRDTDMIPILLLSLYSLQKSHEDKTLEELIPNGMYLDYTNSMQYAIGENQEASDYYQKLYEQRSVVDLISLYAKIEVVLGQLWEGIENPVLCLCLLLIAPGTDYVAVEKVKFGPKSFIDTFFCGGYSLLDKAISLKYVPLSSHSPESTHAESTNLVPVLCINEIYLFEFYRFAYAVTKSAKRVKKLYQGSASEDISFFMLLRTASVKVQRAILNSPKLEKKRKGGPSALTAEDIASSRDVKRAKQESGELPPLLLPLVEKPSESKNVETLKKPAKDMRELIEEHFVYSDKQLKWLSTGRTPLFDRKHCIAVCRRWGWNVLYWILAYRYSLADVSACVSPRGESIFGFKYDVVSNTASFDDVYMA